MASTARLATLGEAPPMHLDPDPPLALRRCVHTVDAEGHAFAVKPGPAGAGGNKT